MAKELYGEIHNLIGRDAEDNLLLTTNNFDEILQQVVNIIVTYDMAWSKLGTGRNYNSLKGYAAIMGTLTGKVLDFEARNRSCRMCDDYGHDPTDHDGRKNHLGSAKSMGADVGDSLVNKSSILKEVNVRVGAYAGDEDSSTHKKVVTGRSTKIFKFADRNHLKRNFGKEIYKLQESYTELKKKDVVPHIIKCFKYALDQNRGQPKKLEKAMQNIIPHLYGSHENCENWCSHVLKSKGPTVILQNSSLMKALETIFEKYAKNAHKMSTPA